MAKEYMILTILLLSLCLEIVTCYTNRASGLVSVPDDIPSTETEVDLHNNDIDTIRRDDFYGFYVLQILRMSGNQISSLEYGALQDLYSITEIDLGSNKLSSIPDFQQVSSTLTKLVIQGNTFTEIPNESFSSLTSLVELELQNGDLLTINEESFVGLGSLTVLQLHQNSLAQLPRNVFLPLVSIQVIQLNNNDLVSLPLFMQPSLQTLNLAENSLVQITNEVFFNSTGLLTLDLRKNLLITFPALNDSASSIENLYLMENQLVNIFENETSTLAALKEVDISRNHNLVDMPYFPLSQTSMETFRAEECKIDSIYTKHFDGFSSLTTISFNNNVGIKAFPVVNLHSLTSIDMTRSDIGVLTRMHTDNLPALQTLRFEGNNLTSFPDLQPCTELQVLDLTENMITDFDSDFLIGLVNLRTIKLGGNQLWEFPNFTKICECDLVITELRLSNNGIRSVPYSKSVFLSNLQKYHLNGNELTDMPYIGSSLTTLVFLNVSRNAIAR